MRTEKIGGLLIHEAESAKELEEITARLGTVEPEPKSNEIYFFKELVSQKMPVYRISFLFLAGNLHYIVLSSICLQDRKETLERSLAEMHACNKLHYLANPDFLNQHLDGQSYAGERWLIDTREFCQLCGKVTPFPKNGVARWCMECAEKQIRLEEMGVGY